MEINERIQDVRKNLGLSRRAFGKKLGVSESVIVNIEFDRLAKPEQKEPIYKLICREFNVNEDWLRTGEGEMFVQRTKNQIITDFLGDLIMEDATFKKRLIEALAELDERDWESLEKLATKLTSKKD